MLIVVAGLLDQTKLPCSILPLLLFTVDMFETFEPHYATVAQKYSVLLFNLFKIKNCLVKAPMLVVGSFGFDS